MEASKTWAGSEGSRLEGKKVEVVRWWHDEALDSYGNFGRTLLRLGPEPPEPALAAERWDVCRSRASWSGSDAF
ncbi:hypothetical protein MRX96_028541 [Rhipicephalus microplus]